MEHTLKVDALGGTLASHSDFHGYLIRLYQGSRL